MSTSTENLFKKVKDCDKHTSPTRQFIPKSKSLELNLNYKYKIDMIECQTYHIHHFLDEVKITVQTTPYLPQIGLFLTNDDKTYIIIDVNQELKAVEFNYHLLLSKINHQHDHHHSKRQLYQEQISNEEQLILPCVDIVKLFNGFEINTFIVDVQGYKNCTHHVSNNHFIISNQFKNV